MRKCKKCGEEKELDLFVKKTVWRSHTCKSCYAASYRTGKPALTRFKKGMICPKDWIEKREKTKKESDPSGKFKKPKVLRSACRTSLKHNLWSLDVKNRDGKCKECGTEKNLTAHHIIPWKNDASKRFDLDNGITLCRSCHSRLERLLEVSNGTFKGNKKL